MEEKPLEKRFNAYDYSLAWQRLIVSAPIGSIMSVNGWNETPPLLSRAAVGTNGNCNGRPLRPLAL